MERKGVSHQVVKLEQVGGAEASELYCEGLFKESVVRGDVREVLKEVLECWSGGWKSQECEVE